MADKRGGSVNEIINSVACELAKKRMNFEEADKDNQEKLTLLSLEISKQQEEVQESIESIYNTIKAQYFGMVLPTGLRQEVAEHVLVQVNEKDLYSASEIEIGDATVKEILVSALQNSDKVESQQNESFGNKLESQNIQEKMDINKLIKGNTDLRNKIAPQAFDKAHRSDATQDEKDLAAVMMGISELDDFILLEMDFEELDSFDRTSIVTTIKVLLKNGKDELAQNYMKAFRISEETLASEQFSNGSIMLDTDSKEEDEIAKKINIIANKIRVLAIYGDKSSEDKKNTLFENLIQEINQSDYPIDGILHGLSQVGDFIDLNNSHYVELLEILQDKLKDPNNNLLLDGYVTKNFMLLAKSLMEKDIGLTSELLEAFNGCIGDNNPKISIEMLKLLTKDSILNIDDNDTLEQDGTKLVVENAFKKSLEDKYKKSPVATIENVTKYLTMPIDLDIKMNLKIEMLSTLSVAETSTIEDEKLVNAKKDLFKTIINNEIKDRNPVDEKLINTLVAIDNEAVKEVLKSSLIPAQNASPSIILEQYIQEIGKTVKDETDQKPKKSKEDKEIQDKDGGRDEL